MKTSQKIACVLIVLAIYATLTYLVFNFVDAANAGLHMTP